ncbi:MAG: hypothetical protein BWK76_12830 [Desulfobulbaceae bacterium A2]|nr:MAG: hypothetical protein BWK76_12830 [Desulfobulbaceae bacterium A2]
MDLSSHKYRPGILSRVVLPLSVALFLLIAIAVVLIYRVQQSSMQEQVRLKVAGVRHHLAQVMDTEARLLAMQQDLIVRDQDLLQAFVARDRDRLLHLSAGLNEQLRSRYNITHMYFVLPDQTCFLRMHHPAIFGDRIERHTMQRAATSGQPAHGLELGLLGTFTLRRVQPWIVAGECIGYIELGIDTRFIPAGTAADHAVELVMSLQKKWLDREKWAAGQRFLGLDPAGWDRLDDQVIVSSTLATVPDSVVPHLNPSHGIHRDKLCTIAFNGRTFFGATQPLLDAGDREVGVLLLLDDVTLGLAALNRAAGVLVMAGLLLWGGLTALLGSQVRRLEGRLSRSITQLQESEQRWKFALEGSRDGVWDWDVSGNTVFYSKRWKEMLGHAEEEIGSELVEWESRLHPEDRERVRQEFQRHLVGEDEYYECEHRLRCQDGSWKWILDRGKVLSRDAAGAPLRVIGTHTDISEHRQAVEALRVSEENLRLAQAVSHTGSWFLDIASGALTWSEESYRLFGLPPATPLTVDNFFACIHPDDRDAVLAAWNAALAGADYDIEHRTFSHGEVRWVRERAEIRRADDGSPLDAVGTVQDITDRKRADQEREKLQAQLVQAQKMESVGRLAGGIAHDFNNKLGVILGYTEMAMMRSGQDELLGQFLEEIRTAAERSADLTSQMLAYARRQTISPRILDLNDTVGGMLKMLHRLIGEDITLAWQPGGGLWPVKLDPTQVDQILANLVVNARDAIRGAGNMTIETANQVIDADYCAANLEARAGDFVMLAVSDDGCGMSQQIQNHIFEPFFTTKGVGEGTGLGLATVYGIIKQNNGWIGVYSEIGQGTTFKMYFPRHRSDAIPHPAVDEVSDIPRGHGELVLLVEDELPLLDLGKMMLKNLGYQVVTAGSPAEALQRVREQTQPFDLMVIDVIMPGMNGRDLVRQLRSSHPGLRCLFISGYTANAIAHHGVLDEDTNFLQKPFTLQGLAEKVHQVLTQSQA